MNRKDTKYAQFALVQEMMETVELVRNFDPNQTQEVAAEINKVGRLLLSGEGSSRLFPAKNLIRQALKRGTDVYMVTDGSHQAAQYNLAKFAVFCVSNSGRTKETVLLAQKAAALGNPYRYALTANQNTVLERECVKTFVLRCGWERAVAATKSVVEQALFYQSILWHLTGENGEIKLAALASCMQEALTMVIHPDIIKTAIGASTIYFAGYNDGVAEELTLKTNEITRRKSDFLEGTYAVHGIEEVMEPQDIVFIIDPIDAEIEKLQQVLGEGVGLKLFAIADRDTPLPTLHVPGAGELTPFVYLCAGWNVLVDIGLALGIDLDKPERARKVGNEFVQG